MVLGHYVRGEGGNAVTRKRIYRVIFFNQGQAYEIYAHKVGQGDMMGFVGAEKLSFGERSEVLVDPSEERLKSEFEGVGAPTFPCTRSSVWMKSESSVLRGSPRRQAM